MQIHLSFLQFIYFLELFVLCRYVKQVKKFEKDHSDRIDVDKVKFFLSYRSLLNNLWSNVRRSSDLTILDFVIYPSAQSKVSDLYESLFFIDQNISWF